MIYSYIYENVPKLRTKVRNAADSFEQVYMNISDSRFDRVHMLIILGSLMTLSVVIVLIPILLVSMGRSYEVLMKKMKSEIKVPLCVELDGNFVCRAY